MPLAVAEDMLRFSPRYRDGKDKLELHIPGSLLEQKLNFNERVALFSSKNNPGASDAANEMHLAFNDIILTDIGPPRRQRSTQQPPRGSVLGLLPRRRLSGAARSRRLSDEPHGATRRTSQESPTQEGVVGHAASSTSSARGHSGGPSAIDVTPTHFLLCNEHGTQTPQPSPKPRLSNRCCIPLRWQTSTRKHFWDQWARRWRTRSETQERPA